MFSIPIFKVAVLDGHPAHAPFICKVTTPFSKEQNVISPPSIATAGLTRVSNKSFICLIVSVSSILFDSELLSSVALIAGTTVFYDDVSKYSTTKLFGADTLPQWNLTENIINLASVEKTLIFVAKPVQVIAKIEEILKFVSAPIAKESKNSQKWGAQSIVMDGKIYHQTSGIFNMLYQYDSSLMTDFSSKTASKYETVFGGCNIASTMTKLEETGHDTSDYMPFVTAAMNDNWEKVKGYRKVFVDSIS